MSFFRTENILMHIDLGGGVGYALSWIEAMGIMFGLLCIWCASKEKTINYLFGLISVTLFSVIFFQIHLYASLLLQLFFFGANIYGWYIWSHQAHSNHALLYIRWLSLPKAIMLALIVATSIPLMAINIDRIFASIMQIIAVVMQSMGIKFQISDLQCDAFPFWDSVVMVLSIVAMILMIRKYVENWLLWIVIDAISVAIFVYQGVYAMALEYIILAAIALHSFCLWMKSARQNHSYPLSTV